jgi:hypothetical protein
MSTLLMEKLFSCPGQKMTSVLVKRLGGIRARSHPRTIVTQRMPLKPSKKKYRKWFHSEVETDLTVVILPCL